METEFLINHIELLAGNAHAWGFIIVFVLMTIESSFIPFPSEVIMIPAGFLAYRGTLTFGEPLLDLCAVIAFGVIGSLVGAFINYYLALALGRPFLYRWGKYFFIKPNTLERAEEIFRKYGDMATFVCRLLPAIRQLISIPAGISRMSLRRFGFFTGLGALIWSAILAFIGYYLGSISKDMTYADLVHKGKDMLMNNYGWILLFLVVFTAVYYAVHHMVMKSGKKSIQE
jgi:membrane protein DedA with SNARE-associated domain